MSRIMSKQKAKPVISKTGIEVSECYCRRCRQTKSTRNFYDAVDRSIDTNGFMSVCNTCINEMFDSVVLAEGSIEVAVLKLCRKLNLKYSEEAIESTKRHIEAVRESGKTVPPFFGTYKNKLSSIQRGEIGQKILEDLTYQEVTTINLDSGINLQNYNPDVIEQDVIDFWGNDLKIKDYRWLEGRLDRWKKTHKCDTEAEETLLREIVFKQFDIEKARKDKGSTANLVKDLQELMKTANLDPAKSAIMNSGKSNETFSSFIKMIEENEPAEYYQDKKLFKDFDNLLYYFKRFVERPLKNFITGSRDFNLEASDDEEELESEIDISMGEETESEV